MYFEGNFPTPIGAISIPSKQISETDFHYRMTSIEGALNNDFCNTKRTVGCIGSYLGSRAKHDLEDITLIVFACKDPGIAIAQLTKIGQAYDFDNVVTIDPENGQAQMTGTSKRAHAFPNFQEVVNINKHRLGDQFWGYVEASRDRSHKVN